jgi:uncharacterized protein YbaR (Trm112 family)
VSRVVITATGTAAGPRVLAGACPVCRRPLLLTHAGYTDADDAEYVDLGAISLAQALHARQCTG